MIIHSLRRNAVKLYRASSIESSSAFGFFLYTKKSVSLLKLSWLNVMEINWLVSCRFLHWIIPGAKKITELTGDFSIGSYGIFDMRYIVANTWINGFDLNRLSATRHLCVCVFVYDRYVIFSK
jgi:hypothetical protein